MLSICTWLEATPLGTFVRESLWAFPVIVGIHIVTLTFSVGAIIWFDLRLLGVSLSSIPASKVYRQIIPVATAGFIIMFVTGALLFTGFATNAYKNVYFRMKLLAIVFAGINAFVYHAYSVRHAERDDKSGGPMALGPKVAGYVSLALWTIVILAGRMISYTLYSH